MVPLPPTNGKTILVTGINGYIASVLSELILSKGYSLRGTTRSLRNTDPLMKGAFAAYSPRIEILEVPDIAIPGAFDEAVKGVHGIFHVASPISFTLQKYDDFIPPAVAGTTSILTSALHHAGPQLTSLVVTSSVSAIADSTKPPGYTFTEADFASSALAAAEASKATGENPPLSGVVLYPGSKQAAEKAFWAFKDSQKPPFALSAILPSVTIGPPVHLWSSPSGLPATLQAPYSIFTGGPIPPGIGTASFVDVRDVALMHMWAYEHPQEADGERYIATSGFGPPQAIADILREAYPDRRGIITAGNPGSGYVGFEDGVVKEVRYLPGKSSVSGEKAKRVMGIKFRGFRESLLNTVKAMEAYL